MRSRRRPIGLGRGRARQVFPAEQLEDRHAQRIGVDIPVKDQVNASEPSVMRKSGFLRIYDLECHQLQIEAPPKHSPSPNVFHSNGNDPQSNSATSDRR
jgi:hypothetical protein